MTVGAICSSFGANLPNTSAALLRTRIFFKLNIIWFNRVYLYFLLESDYCIFSSRGQFKLQNPDNKQTNNKQTNIQLLDKIAKYNTLSTLIKEEVRKC